MVLILCQAVAYGVVAGKIVQSTLDECREAYVIWINMVLFDLFLFFLSLLSLSNYF